MGNHKSYNGHRNHSAWNVSLWLSNDEGLYNMMKEHVRRAKTKDAAAASMLESLKECGVTKTPDGTPYTKTNIRLAMREI